MRTDFFIQKNSNNFVPKGHHVVILSFLYTKVVIILLSLNKAELIQ